MTYNCLPVIIDWKHPASPGHAWQAWVNELMSKRYQVSFKDHQQYYNGRNQLRTSALALITAEPDRVIPSCDTVHCPRMPHANQPMPHFRKVLTQLGLEPRTFHFWGEAINLYSRLFSLRFKKIKFYSTGLGLSPALSLSNFSI